LDSLYYEKCFNSQQKSALCELIAICAITVYLSLRYMCSLYSVFPRVFLFIVFIYCVVILSTRRSWSWCGRGQSVIIIIIIMMTVGAMTTSEVAVQTHRHSSLVTRRALTTSMSLPWTLRRHQTTTKQLLHPPPTSVSQSACLWTFCKKNLIHYKVVAKIEKRAILVKLVKI